MATFLYVVYNKISLRCRAHYKVCEMGVMLSIKVKRSVSRMSLRGITIWLLSSTWHCISDVLLIGSVLVEQAWPQSS